MKDIDKIAKLITIRDFVTRTIHGIDINVDKETVRGLIQKNKLIEKLICNSVLDMDLGKLETKSEELLASISKSLQEQEVVHSLLQEEALVQSTSGTRPMSQTTDILFTPVTVDTSKLVTRESVTKVDVKPVKSAKKPTKEQEEKIAKMKEKLMKEEVSFDKPVVFDKPGESVTFNVKSTKTTVVSRTEKE